MNNLSLHDYLTTAFKAAALSWLTVGYGEGLAFDVFQKSDGSNILCDIDPDCHGLSQEEIDQARIYYGDTVDYSQVRVFSRPSLTFSLDRIFHPNLSLAILYVKGNNIYNGPESHQIETEDERWEVFAHEMMHIHQAQNWSVFENLKHHLNIFDKGYSVSIDEHEHFSDFGVEQQAAMVQNIIYRRGELQYLFQTLTTEAVTEDDINLIPLILERDCTPLNILEKLVAQELPLQITECPQYNPAQTPAP